jgi:hypothetical protein
MRVPDHILNDLKWKLNFDSPPYLLDRQTLQDIITELEEWRQKFERDWERGYEDYDDD